MKIKLSYLILTAFFFAITAAATPRSTTRATLTGNLDSTASTVDLQRLPLVQDYRLWNSLAEFSATAVIFDRVGVLHGIHVFFFKVATGRWKAVLLVSSEELSGRKNLLRRFGNITLNYNSDGVLISPHASILSRPITWINHTHTKRIRIGLRGFTQFPAQSDIFTWTMNGHGAK